MSESCSVTSTVTASSRWQKRDMNVPKVHNQLLHREQVLVFTAQTVVNQVHNGANKSKLVSIVHTNRIIPQLHRKKAQQPRTSGLVFRCIFSAKKKMQPRRAVTRWMTCYQFDTSYQNQRLPKAHQKRQKGTVSTPSSCVNSCLCVEDPLKMVFTHQRPWNCRNPRGEKKKIHTRTYMKLKPAALPTTQTQ